MKRSELVDEAAVRPGLRTMLGERFVPAFAGSDGVVAQTFNVDGGDVKS